MNKKFVIQNSDGRYISNLRYVDFSDDVNDAVTFCTKESANDALKRMRHSEEWKFFSTGDKPKLTIKVKKN